MDFNVFNNIYSIGAAILMVFCLCMILFQHTSIIKINNEYIVEYKFWGLSGIKTNKIKDIEKIICFSKLQDKCIEIHFKDKSSVVVYEKNINFKKIWDYIDVNLMEEFKR